MTDPERSTDICVCGDTRIRHPNNGPCEVYTQERTPGGDSIFLHCDCDGFTLSEEDGGEPT